MGIFNYYYNGYKFITLFVYYIFLNIKHIFNALPMLFFIVH